MTSACHRLLLYVWGMLRDIAAFMNGSAGWSNCIETSYRVFKIMCLCPVTQTPKPTPACDA